MNRIVFFLLLSLLSQVSLASHNRAGEIVFERTSDENPFEFKITVITYTKTGGASDQADDCSITVVFGDGTEAEVARTNGPVDVQNCPDARMGVQFAGTNIKRNEYEVIHEFPGPGTYVVSMTDQNRNDDVLNIPNPGSVAFYIESHITIDVSSGGNNAPLLLNPPIDNGCINKVFEHNPGAVDLDGDSLVYSLAESRAADGLPISGYQFPDQINANAFNEMSIDSETGTLTWDTPQTRGEYNVAIRIEEYRRNPFSGQVLKVGELMRDLQITIGVCDEEEFPPQINNQQQACVRAGEVLNKEILVIDQENDEVELTVSGIGVEDGDAYLAPQQPIGTTPLNAQFYWETSCEDVSRNNHWFYFKAKETGVSNEGLVDFEELSVRVLTPEVEIEEIVPSAITSALELQWSQPACDQTDGYDIYRYTDSLGYAPLNCNLEVPKEYELIASLEGVDNRSYFDDDNGNGLINGRKYCYIIVSNNKDGSKSYPSYEGCGELIKNVPILKKVSVGVTDSINGVDTVSWFSPVELDRSKNPPPYAYSLLVSSSKNGQYREVFRSPTVYDPLVLDSTYIVNGLNTVDSQYYFRIELLSGTYLISKGSARHGSSIFLRSEPNDNQLKLIWEEDVPWVNEFHEVYQVLDLQHPLDSIVFVDTAYGDSYTVRNLVNERPYTFMVKSVGEYTSNSLPGVLVNYSNIHTGIPVDLTAPCAPPNLFAEGDCDLSLATVTWDNPNLYCDSTDDVISYNVYFTPVLGQSPELVETINDPDNTQLLRENLASIAGCYAITAVDSFGNESELTNGVCMDNCPIYELPNIFTPGNDGVNDYFVPFPYKYVESINLTIYNRWGKEVFQTNDPDVNWDGRDMNSGILVPAGVYYYVCTVNEYRLTGIVPREISHYVQIVREANGISIPFSE